VEYKRLNAFGMAGTISKFTSSRAGSYPLRLLSVLFLCAAPIQEADAALVTLDYSGTFQHIDWTDPDTLGLNGASFQFTFTYDNTALRSGTNNLNTDWWFLSLEAGSSATLTISGSSGNDGIYQSFFVMVDEGTSEFSDSLYISAEFNINGLELGPFSSFQLPAGFTGAISATNTISAFSTSDLLDTYGLMWSARESIFNDDTPINIYYDVQSASITSIPEPTSAILLAISTTAFILRRGRKKTASS
jgi:hypothetical protein